MRDDILLHPKTSQLLAMYLHQPSGNILLVGNEGSGKEFTAHSVALALLGLTEREKLSSYPYWTQISPDGTTISIEAIRLMQNSLKLSLPKGSRRVVAIIDAHTMTPEAQNALLKTLEEPPQNTYIIVTADKPEALLATIRSRLQTVPIQPPTAAAITEYYKQSQTTVQPQHIALARGRVGLLDALTTDTDHPLTAAIQTAKQLVGASVFERLAMTDKLIKQKDQLQTVLDGMAIIYRTLVANNAQAGKHAVATQCAQRLAHVLDTQEQLRRSVQAKLALDTLFLNI